MSEKTRVDFWFDPFCPWSWIASRWILEAQKVRDIDVSFHLMSLAILNEDDLPPQLSNPKIMAKVWAPVRVVAAAERAHGSEILGPLYAALGSRIHTGDNKSFGDLLKKDFDEIVAGSLAEVGLPAGLADAVTSEEYQESLRASTDEGLKVPGAVGGVPTIHVNGVAVFGPVLSRIPRGEEAGELWDAALALVSYSDFWEIKRKQPKDLTPDVS
ncbi:disulfide bond formation protein DsbA [Streptomyces malaysiensis subsp. malaysiensis]|uniref:mycothiol-dependent nitroreductase Rv2466c family protein n=1 Tax=Streptomyces malaysiensis TaxID=92644 RepID=UPI000BFE8997|nr:DsbA family protein [Streptomyces malaysiensis]ATL88109.1 DsbA oxidoreductase [Streptomyces malaysiensis]QDL68565.1 disulfide bond formation protein DsbA [Streptomyces malaysiensis]